MKVDEELRLADCRTVWKTYLGFLDLDTDGYMEIQNRLMLEQMQAWCSCGLGQKFLKGKMPATVAEFREAVPLTNYDDYAEILLEQREDMLPRRPPSGSRPPGKAASARSRWRPIRRPCWIPTVPTPPPACCCSVPTANTSSVWAKRS